MKTLKLKFSFLWASLLLVFSLASANLNAEVKNSSAPINISGVVKDDTGLPLPGVSVKIKGTNQGVATNVDGAYTITVPSTESVLVFTSIGWQTAEVKVGNRTTINVTLKAQASKLDEVVVVGYGTQKRSEVTTAITSIKA